MASGKAGSRCSHSAIRILSLPAQFYLTQGILFSGRLRVRGGKWSMATPGSLLHWTYCPSPHKAQELLPLAIVSHLKALNQSWDLQGLDWQAGVTGPSLKPGTVSAPGNHEVEGRVSFKDLQGPLPEDMK